jgi:hypothetical protein
MASALDRAVDVVTAARKESANGRLKRDTMAGILSGMPPDCTSHTIYNEERKRRKRRCVEEEILDTTIDVPELEPALNKGGRPLGATNEARQTTQPEHPLLSLASMSTRIGVIRTGLCFFSFLFLNRWLLPRLVYFDETDSDETRAGEAIQNA